MVLEMPAAGPRPTLGEHDHHREPGLVTDDTGPVAHPGRVLEQHRLARPEPADLAIRRRGLDDAPDHDDPLARRRGVGESPSPRAPR